MRIPVWLTLGVAALIIIFGVYRITLSRRSDEDEARAQKRKGLYGMARRTHFLIGIVYLLLGAAIVATSFGWNPFGNFFGPSTEEPAKDKAPSKGIPIDKLPTK
jgi:cadmium resistance protein CadD (predicted permease)